MKDKEGFTLIELLAVIVILAIISLIATPIVLNMIKNARVSAAKSSSLGYIDSIEKYAEFSSAEITGYDAKFPKTENDTVTCKFESDTWTDVSPTIGCNNFMIAVNDKTKGNKPTKMTLVMNKYGKVLEGTTLTINGFNCSYLKNDVTCDGNEISSTTPSLPAKAYTIVTDDNLNGVADIGEVIKINNTDEEFYVISKSSEKINALAKYNLNAGSFCTKDGISSCTQIENPTYKQDSEMRGFITGVTIRKGTLSFSNTNGWPSSNNNNIDIQLYNGQLKSALNAYKDILPEGIDVRLLTRSEIETLINNGESISGDSIKDMADAKGYSWIYDTSYWLGTVYNNTVDRVLGINTDGVFDQGLYTYTIGLGVRPVITIDA